MFEPKFFYLKLTRNRVDKIVYSTLLTCDPAPFSGKNIPNIAVTVFIPEMGDEAKTSF